MKANERNTTTTVVPALPGFDVVELYRQGGLIELIYTPVVAWIVQASFDADGQPNRSDTWPVSLDPITTYDTIIAIRQPNGTILFPGDLEFKKGQEAEALAYALKNDKRAEAEAAEPVSNAATQHMIEELRQRFPAAFCSPPQPLAIGIGPMIAAELFPHECEKVEFWVSTNGKTLSSALQDWTHRPDYLAACLAGERRVNLEGKPIGAVSLATSDFAHSELCRMRRNASHHQ